jgi:hypothetical protein
MFSLKACRLALFLSGTVNTPHAFCGAPHGVWVYGPQPSCDEMGRVFCGELLRPDGASRDPLWRVIVPLPSKPSLSDGVLLLNVCASLTLYLL